MKTTANGTTAAQVNSNREKMNAANTGASMNQNRREELPNLAPITDEIARNLGYQVEQMTGDTRRRAFYYYRTESGQERRNSKGERLLIEVSHCEDSKSKNSLPALWEKHGYTPDRLATYWSLHTYVYDVREECWGRYNPQEKLSEDGKRLVIDFDYMKAATAEHFETLLKETARRFMAAK